MGIEETTEREEARKPRKDEEVFRCAVDIIERDTEFVLVADVPGANPDDIDLSFEEGTLRIAARVLHRHGGNGREILQEFRVGDYARAFKIPEVVDVSRIQADYTNGVLTVRLPKSEAYKPRKITVRAV